MAMSELPTRQDLSAQAIGYLLVEFSRLEHAIGMAFAWQDGGSDLAAKSERYVDETNWNRLTEITARVAKKYLAGKARDEWDAWLSQARSLATIRNRLVHGRWGFCADGRIASVKGLAASSSQEELRYTLAEMEEMRREFTSCLKALSRLRDEFPI
jgi:hypothetical protein